VSALLEARSAASADPPTPSHQDLVADYLRTEKVSYDIYDGRMNRKEREETIRAFNGRKNPQVLLLSLKAGGVVSREALLLVRTEEAPLIDAPARLAGPQPRPRQPGRQRPSLASVCCRPTRFFRLTPTFHATCSLTSRGTPPPRPRRATVSTAWASRRRCGRRARLTSQDPR
jgi:hypothetical protein